MLTEVGLAAELHGDDEQARSLEMQLALVDECGCAGATVFSWTDEWATGNGPVEGWGFGLTHEDRSPRPALEVASALGGPEPARPARVVALDQRRRVRLQRGTAPR